MSDPVCAACGKTLAANARFCPACGRPDPAAPAAPAATPAFCSACGKPLAVEAKFCAACGTAVSATASAPSASAPPAAPPPPAAIAPRPPAPAAPASGGGCMKAGLTILVIIFVLGVAGQLGWQYWQDHQRTSAWAAADTAFLPLVKPLVGTWKVVEDPEPERRAYTGGLRPTSSRGPEDASQGFELLCPADAKAPLWFFSQAVDGKLRGGGFDQRTDLEQAVGSAEIQNDGRRLVLTMTWDSGKIVRTVLEKVADVPPSR